jgi:hypothetical protein
MVFASQVVTQYTQGTQMDRTRREQFKNYWETPPETGRGNSMKRLALAEAEPPQTIVEQ